MRPNSYKSASCAQGSDLDSSELWVHAMEDSSDNGPSSEEENRRFKDIDSGKYGRLK